MSGRTAIDLVERLQDGARGHAPARHRNVARRRRRRAKLEPVLDDTVHGLEDVEPVIDEEADAELEARGARRWPWDREATCVIPRTLVAHPLRELPSVTYFAFTRPRPRPDARELVRGCVNGRRSET